MFSDGVERALRVTIEAHDGQMRKGTGGVPYIVHPVHVALLVRGYRDDDALIQAALLHDVVEDCAAWTHERVAASFGERVAGIVAELSEDKEQDWATRKQAGIDRVPSLSADAALVQACDKLHNYRTLLEDLRGSGDPAGVWSAFRGGRQGTLEVARAMAEALAARVPAPLGRALHEALEALEAAS